MVDCYTEEADLYHEMNQALRDDDAEGLGACLFGGKSMEALMSPIKSRERFM